MDSSQVHKKHFQIDHMLGHKTWLSRIQKPSLVNSMNVKEQYIQIATSSKVIEGNHFQTYFMRPVLQIPKSDIIRKENKSISLINIDITFFNKILANQIQNI